MKGLMSLLIVLCLTAITQAQGVMSFVTLLPEYKNDVVMPRVLPLVQESIGAERFLALTALQNEFNALEKIYVKPAYDQTLYFTDHGSGRRGLLGLRRFGSCSSSNSGYTYNTTYSSGGGYGLGGRRDRPLRLRNALPRNWRVNQ